MTGTKKKWLIVTNANSTRARSTFVIGYLRFHDCPVITHASRAPSLGHGSILDFAGMRMFSTLAGTRLPGIPPRG